MSLLMAYFWPGFAAALVIGAAAATIVFRRKLARGRQWLGLALGAVVALGAALAWSGPLGGAGKLTRTIETEAADVLHFYEMAGVTGRLQRAPLSRRLLLQGPADDFQRSELVRIMDNIPGVSSVTWNPQRRGLPLALEMALVALAGYLLGMLLAYLVELRRRYNAQWKW